MFGLAGQDPTTLLGGKGIGVRAKTRLRGAWSRALAASIPVRLPAHTRPKCEAADGARIALVQG
jgi:hypothetical protein